MILLTVLATRTPNPNAAMKLKKAANTTAFRGERTRVETTVEIELAESWNPFVKSKTSATPMIMTTSSTDEIGIHWVLCQESTSRIVSWLIPVWNGDVRRSTGLPRAPSQSGPARRFSR